MEKYSAGEKLMLHKVLTVVASIVDKGRQGWKHAINLAPFLELTCLIRLLEKKSLQVPTQISDYENVFPHTICKLPEYIVITILPDMIKLSWLRSEDYVIEKKKKIDAE